MPPSDRTSSYVDKPSPEAGAREFILKNNGPDIDKFVMATNMLKFHDMLAAL